MITEMATHTGRNGRIKKMKKEEILKTINEYIENDNIALLLDLKEKLLEDIRQEPFKTGTSEKKQLKAIEKLLNYLQSVILQNIRNQSLL